MNCYFASTTIDFLRGNDQPFGELFHYPVTGPGDVYSDPVRSGGGQGHLQITHSAALMHFITGAGKIRHADGSEEQFQAVEAGDLPEGCEQPENLYPLHATANNLVDVITGKQSNGSPAEYGWWTVELLDAAYRSAELNGQMVSVESLYN